MTQTANRDHVETVAKAFEQPDWYVNGYAANIRVRCEIVSSFLKGRKFARVLDIGCGDGSLSLQFLGSGCHVTYLDLSSAMLDIVKGRIPETLRGQAAFVKGDVGEAELPAGSFDVILFVGVLAYISDVGAVAKRIARLMRPGGVLVMECTDATHFIGRINFGYRDLTSVVRRAKCVTYRHRPSDVTLPFEQAGFRLARTFRYTYSMPFVSRFLDARRSYALMRRLYGTADQPRNQGCGSELLMCLEYGG